MTSDRLRVLLVDDQIEVVEGLRRVLARVARDFDFDLVGSGQEAVARLDLDTYAVVVSDLRMAEMNGIELLELVARRAPTVGRVLLSGTLEADEAARALSIAHRFLCKPCNARKLAETCRQLQRLKPDLRTTNVGAIRALAIEESAVARVRTAVDRQALVRAVGAHPALIAAVLHSLGSEFLGSRAEPTTLDEAISYIGHDGIDRVLNSGALLVVDEQAAAPIIEHVAAAQARAERVAVAGGTAEELLAALLVDVDQLGTLDGRWAGLRPPGGDVALLSLWGVTVTLIDRVRAMASCHARSLSRTG